MSVHEWQPETTEAEWADLTRRLLEQGGRIYFTAWTTGHPRPFRHELRISVTPEAGGFVLTTIIRVPGIDPIASARVVKFTDTTVDLQSELRRWVGATIEIDDTDKG